MNKPRVTAILLSAGDSNRMNKQTSKQLIQIAGESIVSRTARAFADCSLITNIIIVARLDDIQAVKAQTSNIPLVSAVIPGGDCRAESAKIGFLAAKASSDFVAIHDGARCLVTPEIIDNVVSAAISCGAASAGTLVTDTVKMVDGELSIKSTLDRSQLCFATTPQVFSTEIYAEALERYRGDMSLITDDNMLVEAIGVDIKIIDCGKENIKITTADDLDLAEFLLEKRKRNE